MSFSISTIGIAWNCLYENFRGLELLRYQYNVSNWFSTNLSAYFVISSVGVLHFKETLLNFFWFVQKTFAREKIK